MLYIENQATEKLMILREYLSEGKINKYIQTDVLNHFKQIYKNPSAVDVDDMLQRLPNNIKLKLLIASNKNIMNNIAIFKYIKNDSVKFYLLNIMTLQVGAIGRRLCHQGEVCSGIIFLVVGTAAISETYIDNDNNNSVNNDKYKNGDSIDANNDKNNNNDNDNNNKKNTNDDRNNKINSTTYGNHKIMINNKIKNKKNIRDRKSVV